MAIRTADAVWNGTLREGDGHMRLGGGAYDGRYSFASRFEDGGGTNPEELIAAAHAGCFSMALAADLGNAGFKPENVRTVAKVHLDFIGGVPTITEIDLVTAAKVPGLDQAGLDKIAAATKENCPVSRALKSVKINVEATIEP